jgi:hypothetical protein
VRSGADQGEGRHLSGSQEEDCLALFAMYFAFRKAVWGVFFKVQINEDALHDNR